MASRFGRIRRWRMKRAVGVLKPWWGPRIDLAHARLNAYPYEKDRDSGYRMGVYSTLRDLVMLCEDHPAYEINPLYGLVGVSPDSRPPLSGQPEDTSTDPLGPESGTRNGSWAGSDPHSAD